LSISDKQKQDGESESQRDTQGQRIDGDAAARLSRWDRQDLRRRLRPIESACGPTVRIEGRSMILMASNDYLGLAAHPELKKAAIAAIERYGVGSGAARLISGTLPPHRELEASLARFKRAEAALTFGSGYVANLGLIPALIQLSSDTRQKPLILADRLCHASLIDGCRLSGADLRVYRHGDLGHLEMLLLRRSVKRPTWVVTDGVFSMDGDLAPLPELLDLSERYHAHLFVDDAHGTGVMGPDGRGTAAELGVEDRLAFHMGTLGKALGTSGAYLVGSRTLIEYVLNSARSFLYTTAPPPDSCAASAAALRILQNEPARRQRLWQNRRQLVDGFKRLGFHLTKTASPILPVLIGSAEAAVAMADRLFALGIYAPAIRPPTVPPGTSRIRLTVTSEHSSEQLETVLAAFDTAARELQLLP
jgi:glycine C-acetyltransferase/8-amino-7-oxononanoate synthase